VYEKIQISNFKCFRDIEVKGLKRVNLIAGKNAVGKSALLEAIFLHCGAYNPRLTLIINAMRGVKVLKLGSSPWGETAWDSLFHRFNIQKPIEISALNSDYGARMLQFKLLRTLEDIGRVQELITLSQEGQLSLQPSIGATQVLELVSIGDEGSNSYYVFANEKGISQTPHPAPPFLTIFLTPKGSFAKDDVECYDGLVVQGQHERIMSYLKKFEPRIRRLASIQMGDERVLFADIGLKQMLPLSYASEGISRIAKYVINIAAAKGGVVLIDEIENGLHYSILGGVWRTIARAAQAYDVQVFATTHSRETIIAAHEVLSKEKSYDFTYHRLDRIDGDIKLVRYDKSDLGAAAETDFEVR